MTTAVEPSVFPAAFLIRVHDAEARVYEFLPHGEDTSREQTPSGSLLMPLQTDPDVGGVVIQGLSLPDVIGADTAVSIARALHDVSDTLAFLTGVYQRTYRHPASQGFVAHELNQRPSHEREWASSRLVGGVVEHISEQVPPILWSGTHGWFPPGADPSAFGQFYLTPSSDRGEVEWRLHQSGINGAPLASVAWNDKAALQELWIKCQATNPEHELAIQALQDADQVRKSRRRHEYALAVRDARVAFARKKDQIRPRLTEAAVSAATYSTPPTQGDSRRRVIPTTSQIHTLTPYEVFGYRYQRDPLPNIYAAAQITFLVPRGGNEDSPVTADFLERFATNLQALLDEKKLGEVYSITVEGAQQLWVFKNPALAEDHHMALLIPAGAQWRRAAPLLA